MTALCNKFSELAKIHPQLRSSTHNHTRPGSDGSMTLPELIFLSAQFDLENVYITDHNALGYDPRNKTHREIAEHFAQECGITIHTGIELSCWYDLTPFGVPVQEETHFCGLDIDPGNRKMNQAIWKIQESRRKRAKEMIGLIREKGYKIPDYEVLADKFENITLVNIAENVTDPFDNPVEPSDFLEEHLLFGQDCYAPKLLLPVDEAIRLIIAAGGTAVWAHPGTTLGADNFGNFRPVANVYREMGMQGVEGITKKQTREGYRLVSAYCRENSLLCAGGPDTHTPEDIPAYAKNMNHIFGAA